MSKVDGEESLNISNIAAGSSGACPSRWKRADLYVGNSWIQEAGDGRWRQEEPGAAGASSPLAAAGGAAGATIAMEGRLAMGRMPGGAIPERELPGRYGRGQPAEVVLRAGSRGLRRLACNTPP